MGTEATPTAAVTTTPAEATTPVAPAAPAVEPQTPATVETTPAPVTETKTETPAEPAKEAPAEPAKTEPAAYSLKASEGSLLTAEQVTEIETLAKSANLTEAQAKEVLAKQESNVKAYEARANEAFAQTVKGWQEAIKTDAVLGGANLGQTLEHSKAATLHFADETFVKELETSGFGNHPGFVRMMAKIGSAMGSNTAFKIKETTPPPTQKRPQDILYGKKS